MEKWGRQIRHSSFHQIKGTGRKYNHSLAFLFLSWFSPFLPLALPDSFCPSFREPFLLMSAVGRQVARGQFGDFSRQGPGQHPGGRGSGVRWTLGDAGLSLPLPREPSSRSPGPLDLGLEQHLSSSHSTCTGIGPRSPHFQPATCPLSSWRRWGGLPDSIAGFSPSPSFSFWTSPRRGLSKS